MAAMVASRWKQEDVLISTFVRIIAGSLKRRVAEHKKLASFRAIVQENQAVVQGDENEIPCERDRLHNMMNFMQRLPVSDDQSRAPLCIPEIKPMMCSSAPIVELNVSDDDILSMWFNEGQ